MQKDSGSTLIVSASASTNTVPSGKTTTATDIYLAIQQAHALLASTRRLRYRTSVAAPIKNGRGRWRQNEREAIQRTRAWTRMKR